MKATLPMGAMLPIDGVAVLYSNNIFNHRFEHDT